jgi:hypothetical protein
MYWECARANARGALLFLTEHTAVSRTAVTSAVELMSKATLDLAAIQTREMGLIGADIMLFAASATLAPYASRADLLAAGHEDRPGVADPTPP